MFIRLIVFVFLYLSLTNIAEPSECPGRWFNPITDTNWSGFFPIKIGGVTIDAYGMEDTNTIDAGNPFCYCDNPHRLGIKVSFWEPIRIIEVVRRPGCYPTFNGMKIDMSSVVQQGQNKKGDDVRKAFYHIHYMAYPVFSVLELATAFLCLDTMSIDILYLTEVDELWSNDEFTAILNPEAILFANPIAQAVCAADSIASTAGITLDALFWCCGSWGSGYPFSGTVNHNYTPLQTASLETCKFLAKAHRELFLTTAWLTTTDAAMCQKKPLPIIKKSQYRLQLIYPLSSTESRTGIFSLGRNEIMWGVGKWYPSEGEDFAFLIWRKRDCCAL